VNYTKTSHEKIMFILILFISIILMNFEKIYASSKDKSESKRSRSFFISGHSLIDNPFADYLVNITKSLGIDSEYNQQIVIGSPIRVRTQGNNPDSKDFSGYQLGKNREGSGMEILNELRSRSTIRSKQYDYLIITERHDLLSAVIWEGTDKYLRHYRDQFMMNNNGRVYFFVPWLGIMNRKNVTSWIVYEKNALSAWECVVSKINHDLVLKQSPPVYIIPANIALAELVKRLISGSVVEGLGNRSDFDRLDWLFSDDVHLTKMGVYYIALVTYALIFDSSPENAWFPKEIGGKIAMNLQSVAWEFASNKSTNITDIGLAQCSTLFTESFCNVYWDYVGQGQNIQSCRSHFTRENKSNLFYSGAR
jgi:hypothetical protein